MLVVGRLIRPLKGAESLRNLSRQTRSIHLPGRLPPPTKPQSLAHRTRHFIIRFITHLQGPPVSRFVYSTPSIRQSLSLPTRVALSRPLHAPYLPRAAHIPGNVAQVGLGTVRNFSTGRPIFQHIVENVPVAGRAFYEIDWETKARREKEVKARRPKKSSRKVKLADRLQTRSATSVNDAVREYQELDHYFSPTSIPLITTYLQIPLAPTPTARVPLPSGPSPHLLPIPTAAKVHASHSTHSIKVSSLFRRLDAARIWDNGATCETYGDPSGLCTILIIRFEGWTEKMVRNVLGEAGKGWCTIQEIRQEGSLTESSTLSSPRVSSPDSAPSDNEGMAFVMPSLGFSATSSPVTWPEVPADYPSSFDETDTDDSFPSAPQSAFDDDGVSDVSSSAFSLAKEWSSVAASRPRGQSCLGFSSDFLDRPSCTTGID